MALTYNSVIRAAALRINGLAGATSAALETSYTTVPLTTTQVDSADFTLSALKDAALAVESRLATAIASYRDPQTRALHPWRALLKSNILAVGNGASIPSTDTGSNQIIGVPGAVYDNVSGRVCDEMPLDDVRRANRNAGSWLVTPIYGYCIVGNRIEHTRTSVEIEVCVYNRTTQATAIGTLTNNIILPDALEEAYVCGIVSLLVRDDMFNAQAQTYRSYYVQAISQLERGQMPGLAQAA